jgi:23S rRNA pseudouridine955/2504/2580 synthase
MDYTKFLPQFRDMIIYEDDNLIIINKPAGLAVQLGTSTKISVDVMAKAYNLEARLAHRIDKETSGVVILTKNIATARWMLHLFRSGEISKKYVAIVSGKFQSPYGRISLPLSRVHGTSFVDIEHGKEAVTDYRVIKQLGDGKALLEVMPLTGRTHQIRLHLSSINCPILGDIKFGGLRAEHLFLHAHKISLSVRDRGQIHQTAPIPSYFTKLCNFPELH